MTKEETLQEKRHREYKRAFPEPSMDGAHGWIQWKGTDVCMDFHCSCGAFSHFDGEFFYHAKCGKCGQCFQVGSNVRLYPVDPDIDRDIIEVPYDPEEDDDDDSNGKW